MPKKKAENGIGGSANGDRLLRTNEVCDYLRISRATLYRYMEEDRTFPRPKKPRGRNEWSLAAIQKWRDRQR